MIDIKIKGNGPVTGDFLEKLVCGMADVLQERFEELEARMEAQDAKIKRLQSELETERRLRLGSRK